MASNSFGTLFRITTWGESHGSGIGVIVDGCPAAIELNEEMLQKELDRRSPGSSLYTSPRKEIDAPKILSGVYEGKTTGAPISIIIENNNVDSSKYEDIKTLLRPGHANFTYLKKYGIFDYRGGGRASARETAGRVAAGAVARQFLNRFAIKATAYLSAVGKVDFTGTEVDRAFLKTSPLFAPNPSAEAEFIREIESAKGADDSVGGIVSFIIENMPAGIGEPIYAKLPALLAYAMLSIPASKGFEFGEGFRAASMRGSEHNDGFINIEGGIKPSSNHAGGVLGGISTGEPIFGRVAFKPTSSINIPQKTVDIEGNSAEFKLPAGSRHDPIVAVRAVPVVEAMSLLVIADSFLLNCKP
ncbi:MAG: chorismate synthase [Deferribacteraceae bacterium]|nr:chorismate synthase [Deferribacteraceae bacterium]